MRKRWTCKSWIPSAYSFSTFIAAAGKCPIGIFAVRLRYWDSKSFQSLPYGQNRYACERFHREQIVVASDDCIGTCARCAGQHMDVIRSRNTAGRGMAGASKISATARKREIISLAFRPPWFNRFWNLSRRITSSNSAKIRLEAQSVAEPSSIASIKREGFPGHSAPETSTFMSTTNFTSAPLGSQGLYFDANLLHG